MKKYNRINKELLNAISKITIVTKSGHMVQHKKQLDDAEYQKQSDEIHRRHYMIGEQFKAMFKQMFPTRRISHCSLDAFIKHRDDDLLARDGDSKHLVCVVGGDGTFILASHKIRSDHVVTLPINPDPQYSIGKLCGYKYDSSSIDGQLAAQEIAQMLLDGDFKIIQRTRIESIASSKRLLNLPLGS